MAKKGGIPPFFFNSFIVFLAAYILTNYFITIGNYIYNGIDGNFYCLA